MLIECFSASDFTPRHFSINNILLQFEKTFQQVVCIQIHLAIQNV